MAERKRKSVARPELELNLASGLLATITRKDLRALIKHAEEAGFSSFCALPFRGLKDGEPAKLAKEGVCIVHIEDAWNPLSGELYNHLVPALIAGAYGTFLRKFFRKKGEKPLLEDSLFPPKETCSRILDELVRAFPMAKFVSHKASLGRISPDRFLLEIHPGLRMEKEEIISWAQKSGVGLVFDPSHLLERTTVSAPNQPTKLRNYWEGEFNFFADTGLVEVVDIQPPSKKSGSWKEIVEEGWAGELAAAAKEVVSVRYLRVEARLPFEDQLPLISRRRSSSALCKIARVLYEA